MPAVPYVLYDTKVNIKDIRLALAQEMFQTAVKYRVRQNEQPILNGL